MSFKAVFKAIVFLGILFVMLYIGMNNGQSADFYFPVLTQKKITTTAALIYFGMFAVGVLAGTVLASGTGNARGKGWPKGEK
jgi:predicted transporter